MSTRCHSELLLRGARLANVRKEAGLCFADLLLSKLDLGQVP